MKSQKPGHDAECARPKGGPGAAFLLAQVGAHAAARFAKRLDELRLLPAHAGVLRILGSTPAITQQALAGMLRMVPSRLVALVDELEGGGFVERGEDPGDRRRYALRLTERGRSILRDIGRVAREHQADLLAALSEIEQRQLADLLQRVADEQGLTRGVHPGFGRTDRGKPGAAKEG